MQIQIQQVKDESQWHDLLCQSPYSYHGHSLEYQKIIDMNKGTTSAWQNLLITIDDEQYICPLEIGGVKLYSHLKYYAGLIPINESKRLKEATRVLFEAIKKGGYSGMVLSYLQGDPIGEQVATYGGQIARFQGWELASLFDTTKSYDDIYKKVYDCKARNMIRKAEKNGITCRQIQILNHVKDAVDCTKSKPERHGSVMPVYYRDEELYQQRQKALSAILGGQLISFGAFVGDKMVAYINTIRSHHEAIISNLLSHADYWKYAVNNKLFDEVIKYYCEDKEIKHLMYSFDGVAGVDMFKKSIGFKGVPVMRYIF